MDTSAEDKKNIENTKNSESLGCWNESGESKTVKADFPQASSGEVGPLPGSGKDSVVSKDDSSSMQERLEPERYGEPEKISVIEALLFVSAQPLSVGQISEITGFEPGAVREIVNKLSENYDSPTSGLVIREVAGGFGIYTKKEVSQYVSKLIRHQYNPRLTKAALETMAIVAYLQPVSRSTVSEIRGVQSEGVMKTLEDRGLIEPVGRGTGPGSPVLYSTTRKFLERFGLNSIDDLPDLESFAPDDETVAKIRRVFSQEISDGGMRSESGEEGEDTKDTR